MVDSAKDNHEDFVISENYDTEGEEELGPENYYGNQSGILRNKSNLLYLIGGIG